MYNISKRPKDDALSMFWILWFSFNKFKFRFKFVSSYFFFLINVMSCGGFDMLWIWQDAFAQAVFNSCRSRRLKGEYLNTWTERSVKTFTPDLGAIHRDSHDHTWSPDLGLSCNTHGSLTGDKHRQKTWVSRGLKALYRRHTTKVLVASRLTGWLHDMRRLWSAIVCCHHVIYSSRQRAPDQGPLRRSGSRRVRRQRSLSTQTWQLSC